MKKPIDFDKWKKKLVELMPNKEIIFALIGYICFALFEDLRLCFGINLANLSRVACAITFVEFGWCLGWTVELIVYCILKRRKDKKENENKSKSN